MEGRRRERREVWKCQCHPSEASVEHCGRGWTEEDRVGRGRRRSKEEEERERKRDGGRREEGEREGGEGGRKGRDGRREEGREGERGREVNKGRLHRQLN